MSEKNVDFSGEDAFKKEDFYQRFQRQKTSLEDSITQLQNTTLQDSIRISILDQCLTGIARLSTELNNVSHSLPAYDQRTYSTAIKTLNEKLQEARALGAPKRKFAFKKSGVKSTDAGANIPSTQIRVHGSKQLFDDEPQVGRSNSNATSTTSETLQPANTPVGLTIAGLKSAHYILDPSNLQSGSSATVKDIYHSMIDLSITATNEQPLGTLSVNSVAKSLLICGKTSGAAHVTNVQGCTMIISSRQVRMHECRDCVVYLRCSSRPIIEDCEGMKFAPLPIGYETAETVGPNMWAQVDDFKWLRPGHSPHWSILGSKDKRGIDGDGWEAITAGQTTYLGLSGLLKAAKIVDEI